MQVPDKLAVVFFTAVVLAEATAISVLWFRIVELERMVWDNRAVYATPAQTHP